MRIKRGLCLLALSLITVWGFAGEKKLRFSGTGGIVLHNDLLEQDSPGTAGTIGGERPLHTRWAASTVR